MLWSNSDDVLLTIHAAQYACEQQHQTHTNDNKYRLCKRQIWICCRLWSPLSRVVVRATLRADSPCHQGPTRKEDCCQRYTQMPPCLVALCLLLADLHAQQQEEGGRRRENTLELRPPSQHVWC